MADQTDQGLPLDFYGLSYLGKPTEVAVMGQTPSGSLSSVAATPSGGLGGTAPAATATGTGAVTPSGTTGSGSAAQELLQGAGAAQEVGQIASNVDKLSPVGSAANPATISQLRAADAAVPPQPIVDVGGTEVLGAPTGGATELGQQAAQQSSNAAGNLATAGVAALDTVLSQFGGKGGKEASSIIGALGPVAALAGLAPPAAALLAIPDIISLFSGNGLPGFGPPPAISFPTSSWDAMASSIDKSLPPPLTAPEGATPDQQASVKQVNDLIDNIRATYGGAAPPSLGGQQSAETWNNVWQAYTGGAQAQFKKLQDLYAKTQQALQPPAPPPATSAPATGGTGATMPESFFRGGATSSPQDQQLIPGQ